MYSTIVLANGIIIQFRLRDDTRFKGKIFHTVLDSIVGNTFDDCNSEEFMKVVRQCIDYKD